MFICREGNMEYLNAISGTYMFICRKGNMEYLIAISGTYIFKTDHVTYDIINSVRVKLTILETSLQIHVTK